MKPILLVSVAMIASSGCASKNTSNDPFFDPTIPPLPASSTTSVDGKQPGWGGIFTNNRSDPKIGEIAVETIEKDSIIICTISNKTPRALLYKSFEDDYPKQLFYEVIKDGIWVRSDGHWQSTGMGGGVIKPNQTKNLIIEKWWNPELSIRVYILFWMGNGNSAFKLVYEKTNTKDPNQSSETTTMAVTPAASNPSRQP